MATRWTSKHTGQKIDDTIDYVCNPNLLDNWYFGNPVNQRGQTEYVAQSTPGYLFDRWRTHANGNAGDTWTISYKGVLFTANTPGTWRLRQMFESDSESHVGGLTLTFSIKYSGKTNDAAGVSAVIRTASQNYTGSKSYSSDGIATVTATLPADAKGMYVVIQCDGDTSVLFEAVKLELGSQQTLAHQDADGNWVLNEIPDYGEQLRRCQRYQVRVGYAEGSTYAPVLANGVAVSTTSIRALIPTPVTLRVNPSIGYFGSDTLSTVHALGGGASLTPTAALVRANSNGVLLVLTVSGATMNETYAITIGQARGILLDANL